MKTFACILLTLLQSNLLLTLYVPQEYVVPSPIIKVFSPRGFKVSVPDEDGIELFAFHGNINRPMEGLEAGQFSKDILQKKGNRWIFEDTKSKLKEGDVIYYWLFVIKRGLGYRFDGGKFVVKDLTQKTPEYPQEHQVPKQPAIAKNHHKNDEMPNCSPLCELATSLFTQVEKLKTDVKRCREISDVLKDLIDKDAITSRTLKFEGVLPPYDDAQYTAQIILREKLGLSIPVVNATMEDDKSIVFQVVSLDDKIHIIRTAKEKLEKMKSKIILKY